jgi:hypothetical protein
MQADFLALVLALEAADLLRFHPAKTPAEYSRESRLAPSARVEFRELVRTLYGYAFARWPCGPGDFASWRTRAEPGVMRARTEAAIGVGVLTLLAFVVGVLARSPARATSGMSVPPRRSADPGVPRPSLRGRPGVGIEVRRFRERPRELAPVLPTVPAKRS